MGAEYYLAQFPYRFEEALINADFHLAVHGDSLVHNCQLKEIIVEMRKELALEPIKDNF